MPFANALEILKDLGVGTTGNRDVKMSDANKRGFIISRVLAADVLQNMKDELTKALEEVTPFQEFKKQSRELLARRGWTGKGATEGSVRTVDLIPAGVSSSSTGRSFYVLAIHSNPSTIRRIRCAADLA